MTDLVFLSDIKNLDDQFVVMEEKLIGIASDLTPHYYINLNLSYYETHPTSTLGFPGPTQGYNSGSLKFCDLTK